MTYFDNNATTPVMREAREAWLNATENFSGNASSPHQVGTKASVALRDAREKLAGYLGCHANDIIWTSGATEANNTVMHHSPKRLMRKAKCGFRPLSIRASPNRRSIISASARELFRSLMMV